MKFLFESLQTFANHLVGLMPGNYIHIRCVNYSPSVLIRIWILIQKQVDSYFEKKKTRSFENMVMSYFQRTRPECEIESFSSTSRQKKIDCFSVGGFCSHCNTQFEAMGYFYRFYPRQKNGPSFTEEDDQCSTKKRELDELGRSYIRDKCFSVLELWECEW